MVIKHAPLPFRRPQGFSMEDINYIKTDERWRQERGEIEREGSIQGQ
jgi:hypothetical protein